MKKEVKKGTKIGLLCFFLLCEIFFVLVTIPTLFICPPVGIVGAVPSVFFGIVVISIIQSIKGKKPLLNLFREGEKTCKKCGFIYQKSHALSCPKCAERKRKKYPQYDTIAKHNERKRRKEEFWAGVAMVEMIEEFSKEKSDGER